MKNMIEIVEEICPNDFYRARSLKNIGYRYALAKKLKFHRKGRDKLYDTDAEFLIKERLMRSVPKPRLAPLKAMASPKVTVKRDVNLSTIIYKVNPLLGSQETRKYQELDSQALAFIESKKIETDKHNYDLYLTKEDADKVETYLEGRLVNSTDYDIPESKTVILLKEQNNRLINKIQNKDATIERLKSNEAKLHEAINQLLSMLKK